MTYQVVELLESRHVRHNIQTWNSIPRAYVAGGEIFLLDIKDKIIMS
jgi:glutaredoxin-related protein